MSSINAASGSALTYLKSYLESHTTSYQNTMDELSSGNKYNTVGDNPVEVCRSAKMTIAIDSGTQASNNAEIGKDLLNTAAGAQSVIVSNISRIHDLCTEAANGTYSASDKDAIIEEINARLKYINSAADSTTFNGIKLLDGTASNLTLQTGTTASATMNIGSALINVHTDATGLNIDLPSGTTGSNWDNASINTYMNSIDNATNTIINSEAQSGAFLNRLDFVTDNLSSIKTNLTAGRSQITDTDVAKSSADLVRYQVLQQASVSVLAQANQVPSWALQLLK